MKHCEYRALTREEINEVLCSTHVCMLCPVQGKCGCVRMEYTFTEHGGVYTFCLKGDMAFCRCGHEKVTLRIDRCLYGGNEMVEVIGCLTADPSGCRAVATAQAECVTGQAYTCRSECGPCECHRPPKCELECVCEWKCEPEKRPWHDGEHDRGMGRRR